MIFEKFSNLIFPTSCIYCNRITESRIYGFCEECYASLPVYLKKNEKSFYVFEYDKKLSKVLKKAKFGQNPGAIKQLGFLLGEFLKKEKMEIDFVIPVPMFKKDLAERGYNQSFIVAKAVAKELKKPCKESFLRKIKKTKKQSELTKEARAINLQNVFWADEKVVKGKSILLIDDIMTTGATLSECKKTLVEAGARHIEMAVVVYTPVNRR